VKGPFPPDTVFRQGLDQPDKLIVSLYHDQGLIAFKLVAFDRGVNLTLGLPLFAPRLITGQPSNWLVGDWPSPASFQQAIWLAWELGCQKK